MEHFVTAQEVKASGRPIGKMVDDEKLNSYITEVEQLQVKPILGDELFLHIAEELDKDENERDEKVKTLLNGGIYTIVHKAEGTTERRFFKGLKTTISYFVYAQYLMSGDFETTRFGVMLKNGDYSTHVSDKQRSENYNNVIDVANTYMKECVRYCKDVGLIKKVGKGRTNFGGISIRRIG